MAEAYDVLAGLNRMLESQERREQTKLQTSLAMMQFAQSKKMQDVQLAGQQLQMLQTVNTQMSASQAQSFLTSTGFSSLYVKDDDKAAEKAKKYLHKEAGFSENDAVKITTAIWYAHAGNYDPILDIADELNIAFSKHDESRTKGDKLLLKSYHTIDYLSKDELTLSVQESGQLNQMSKTLQNKKNISAEMYEFGRGEFEIQRDIGVYKPADKQESGLDLKRLADAFSEREDLKNQEKAIARSETFKLSQKIWSDKEILKGKEKMVQEGFVVPGLQEEITSLRESISQSESKKSDLEKSLEFAEQQSQVDEIQELADKILEERNIPSTPENIRVAQTQAVDILGSRLEASKTSVLGYPESAISRAPGEVGLEFPPVPYE